MKDQSQMPQCSDEHWAWPGTCQHIMGTSPFQCVLQALCVTKQVGSSKQIKPNKVRYSIYLVSPWSWKWRSIPTRLWGFYRLMLLNFIKWFKGCTYANQSLIVHPTLHRDQQECKKMQKLHDVRMWGNVQYLYVQIFILHTIILPVWSSMYAYLWLIAHIDP